MKQSDRRKIDRRKKSTFDIVINSLSIIVLILVIGWAFRANLKIEQFDIRQDVIVSKLQSYEEMDKELVNKVNVLNKEMTTLKVDINHRLDRITEILLQDIRK
jgi:hypothetical protein